MSSKDATNRFEGGDPISPVPWVTGKSSAAFTAECNNFSIHAIMKAPGGYHEATSISHATEAG